MYILDGSVNRIRCVYERDRKNPKLFPWTHGKLMFTDKTHGGKKKKNILRIDKFLDIKRWNRKILKDFSQRIDFPVCIYMDMQTRPSMDVFMVFSGFFPPSASHFHVESKLRRISKICSCMYVYIHIYVVFSLLFFSHIRCFSTV